MPDTFFTADTHFGHANVIKHSERPFASVEEHDAQLIANWNAVVGEKDTVYHLGDFAWRDAKRYRDQLNGNIALILGNHDKAAEKIKHRFMWVKDVHMIRVGQLRIWSSHYAHRVWPRNHHGAWHLYGHSHGSLQPYKLEGKSMDVGVDAMARYKAGIDLGRRDKQFEEICELHTTKEDYRPISIGAIETLLGYKDFAAVDHHTGPEVGG